MTNYTVTSGNPSIGLTLNNGDQLQVESAAVAEYTTVNSDAYVNVLSNGLLLGATASGGLVAVYAGGTAAGTEVTGGGFQYDDGTDFQTTVNNGTEYVQSAVSIPAVSVSGTVTSPPSVPGGVATSSTLDSDGVQYVQDGGKATDTIVNHGGQEYVQFGGTAKDTQVNSGGVQHVQSGGTAQATTLNNGGVEQVQSGGTAIGTLISAGGSEVVSAGGTASAATVFRGRKSHGQCWRQRGGRSDRFRRHRLRGRVGGGRSDSGVCRHRRGSGARQPRGLCRRDQRLRCG